MAQLVEEFGTGFLRTAVHRTGTGFLWIRSPGPDRQGGIAVPGAGLRAALAAHTPRGMALQLAQRAGDSAVYRVGGSETAARVAVGRYGTERGDRLAEALHAVGRTLAGLHADVPPAAADGSPPAVARVTRWLSTGRGPRGAAALHEVMHACLGPTRWRRLLDWCEEFASPERPDAVLLHGAPSLGSVILGSGRAADRLLIGEEVSRGPAEYDVGWLVGEIVEWRMAACWQGRAAGAAARAAAAEQVGRALLRGYGPPPDTAVMSRAAVVRVLTHAHDFAAYRGWHPELTEYARTLPRLVDETSAGTFLGSAGLL